MLTNVFSCAGANCTFYLCCKTKQGKRGTIHGPLDLSNRNITAVPANAFQGMPSLVKLSLRENKLSTLPSGVFSNLSSLRSLVCLREFESVLVRVWGGLVSLPHICPSSFFLALCISYYFLFSWGKHGRICAALIFEDTSKNVSVSVHVQCNPFHDI